MQQHYRILGILYLVMSGYTVVAAFVVSMVLEFVLPQVNDYEGEQVISFLIIFLPTLLIFLSIPGIVAGIGLLYRKHWALIMAAILAVFNIFSFPFGTALSIYTFYVLVKQEDLKRSDKLRESTKIVG